MNTFSEGRGIREGGGGEEERRGIREGGGGEEERRGGGDWHLGGEYDGCRGFHTIHA